MQISRSIVTLKADRHAAVSIMIASPGDCDREYSLPVMISISRKHPRLEKHETWGTPS